MSGERPLVDTNILVHAYTIVDDRKHSAARSLVAAIWEGQYASTTLQNLCEFFFVVTRKVAKPISITEAQTVVSGILASSQWRVLDRDSETILTAIDLVKLHRANLWDALIAACMLQHGVHTILTDNERDFVKLPNILVINPFKVKKQV